MDLHKISKIFVIIGTIVIWIIKLGIRPYASSNGLFMFSLGIAPNFFGSFLLPFGAYWFLNQRNFLIARVFQVKSFADLRIVCMLGFLSLVFNEYLQLIPVFGRTFDYFDIIFSALGLLISYIVFSYYFYREVFSYRGDQLL